MMKYKELLAVLLGVVVAHFCFAEDADLATKTKVPGTNDKCAGYCLATYSPHTSEEPKNANACEQGCRLFSMLQFAKDSSVENVQGSCDSACKQAYFVNSKRDACFAGCHHQSPFTTGRMEISVDQNSPIADYAHSLFQGMYDRMGGMHRHFMSFFDDDDEDSASEESSPFMPMHRQMDMMHHQMNEMMEDLLGHNRKHSVEKTRETDMMNPLYNFAKNQKEESGNQVGNKDSEGNEILQVRMSFPTFRKEKGETIIDFSPMRLGYIENSDRAGTMESARAFEPSPPVDRDISRAVDPDASWLACLARRARRLSSMTRWMVCLALMLCVMCMIWICLSIMKTAPRRRVIYAKTGEVKAKVDPSTGEKKFLIETFVPPMDGAPPPYQEAEPLPEKEKMPVEKV